MGDIIKFGDYEHCLACPECQSVKWMLTVEHEIICTDCNTVYPDIIWAMLLPTETEH